MNSIVKTLILKGKAQVLSEWQLTDHGKYSLVTYMLNQGVIIEAYLSEESENKDETQAKLKQKLISQLTDLGDIEITTQIISH